MRRPKAEYMGKYSLRVFSRFEWEVGDISGQIKEKIFVEGGLYQLLNLIRKRVDFYSRGIRDGG